MEFLRTFRGAPEPGNPVGTLIYRDQLEQDPPPVSLTVSLDDIIDHDDDLARNVKINPQDYIPAVRRLAATGKIMAGDLTPRLLTGVAPATTRSLRTRPQMLSLLSAPRSRTATRLSAQRSRCCCLRRGRSGRCAA